MDFNEAIKILGIEQFGERIWKSNSHGELFHLTQYIELAEKLKKHPEDLKTFAEWFPQIVKQAEAEWQRPESVFQHMSKILADNLI